MIAVAVLISLLARTRRSALTPNWFTPYLTTSSEVALGIACAICFKALSPLAMAFCTSALVAFCNATSASNAAFFPASIAFTTSSSAAGISVGCLSSNSGSTGFTAGVEGVVSPPVSVDPSLEADSTVMVTFLMASAGVSPVI